MTSHHDKILNMFRENHTLSTMIGGSFMFMGVFMLLTDPITHTAQIGFFLMYLTPIPPIIYWMIKKDKSDDKDAQRLRSE